MYVQGRIQFRVYSSENLDKDNFVYHNTIETANRSFEVMLSSGVQEFV
jgi:hypothetical protein